MLFLVCASQVCSSLLRPLTGRPCVHYEIIIRGDNVRKGKHRHSHEVIHERKSVPFRIVDDSGRGVHVGEETLVENMALRGAEINQCASPAWKYYLLFWPPRCRARVLGVLARRVLGLFTRRFDFRTGTWNS